MKSCYCETCNKMAEYQITQPEKESITIDELTFVAKQKHAYCTCCGEEVSPLEAIDYCVIMGHRKYLLALLCHFKFSRLAKRIYWDIVRLFRRKIYG